MERRKFPRYESAFEVEYTTEGTAAIESYSISKNISRGGICIRVSRIVQTGDILKLNIDPKDDKGPVSAVGRVVWKKDTEKNPAVLETDAGIEFTEINPYEIERLLEKVY